MLCVAILCALGCAYLFDRWRESWQRTACIAAVLVLLLADLLTVPFPNASSFDAPLYKDSVTIMRPCKLPSAAQFGTVLTLPLQQWPYNLKAMAMQLADDGRYPLVDGYVSYASDSVWSEFRQFPALSSLSAMQRTGNTSPASLAGDSGTFPNNLSGDALAEREAADAMVRGLHLSAIVVFDSGRNVATIRYLEDVFGQKPLDAGTCSVFEMQPTQTAPSGQPQGAAR